MVSKRWPWKFTKEDSTDSRGQELPAIICEEVDLQRDSPEAEEAKDAPKVELTLSFFNKEQNQCYQNAMKEDTEPVEYAQPATNDVDSGLISNRTDFLAPLIPEEGASLTEPSVVLHRGVEDTLKLFEEAKRAIEETQVSTDLNELKPRLILPTPILEDAEIVTPFLMNLADLEEPEAVQPIPRYPGFIAPEVTQSAAKKGSQWWTESLLIHPVKGLVRLLHNSIRGVVGLLVTFLKYLLISAALTVLVYVLIANLSDTQSSAYELATQNYAVLKNIIVTFVRDIGEGTKNLNGK